MKALRTFVYLLVEPSNVMSSEQQTLSDLDTAISRAVAIGATRVLVHAGYQRLPDEQAKLHLLAVPQGVWLTAAALAIRPSDWMPEAKPLPRIAGSASDRKRPGRKDDPDSARFRGREIYKANWQTMTDREIKKLMEQQLNIDSRVANTYFIDFRKEMGHTPSRRRVLAATEA